MNGLTNQGLLDAGAYSAKLKWELRDAMAGISPVKSQVAAWHLNQAAALTEVDHWSDPEQIYAFHAAEDTHLDAADHFAGNEE